MSFLNISSGLILTNQLGWNYKLEPKFEKNTSSWKLVLMPISIFHMLFLATMKWRRGKAMIDLKILWNYSGSIFNLNFFSTLTLSLLDFMQCLTSLSINRKKLLAKNNKHSEIWFLLFYIWLLWLSVENSFQQQLWILSKQRHTNTSHHLVPEPHL